MKYTVLGVAVFLATAMFIQASEDDINRAHQLICAEKLSVIYPALYKGCLSTIKERLHNTDKDVLQEATKRHLNCATLEYVKRLEKENTYIIFPRVFTPVGGGSNISRNEYYTLHCPAELYANLSHDTVGKLAPTIGWDHIES